MNTLARDRSAHIGTVLESIVMLSRALANPRSSPFGDTVLTRTQLEILFVLAHAEEPITPGQLAATLQVTPGAITQTMHQLRNQALVEQSSSDSDGRVRVWKLTASAREQVAGFEYATIARMAPWFQALSAGELDQLSTLLSRVQAV